MNNNLKVMILGADGYLGIPLSIDLALKGFNLMLIDNYIKRKLSSKYKRQPLNRTNKIESRIKILKKINKKIQFTNLDCKNTYKFHEVFNKFKPDVVIHFAEIPSAPYSMLGTEEGWNTLDNNLKSTYNLISAVKKYNRDCHIIKLGTMGEYGTPNINIEEGWLNVLHKGRKEIFLYPRQGSSLYHMSKIMDTDLLWFNVRTHDLQVTDLMQGPVYGIHASEFAKDYNLDTSFAYDDIFGTVLNRFIVQAVAKIPLTVYGTGSQIRGYINLKDTLQCINLAIQNPPGKNKLSIYNQFTEQFSVNDLSKIVRNSFKKIDIDVKIQHIKNPRIESEKHYYNADNKGMKVLGLKPTLLTEDIIIKMAKYVMKHKHRINSKIIQPKIYWK
tara:strand:+ start:579 stop:1736 length:1158 start_codon:yes stop_codon:yes gene_type:complete